MSLLNDATRSKKLCDAAFDKLNRHLGSMDIRQAGLARGDHARNFIGSPAAAVTHRWIVWRHSPEIRRRRRFVGASIVAPDAPQMSPAKSLLLVA
jgi:hypothetical protein